MTTLVLLLLQLQGATPLLMEFLEEKLSDMTNVLRVSQSDIDKFQCCVEHRGTQKQINCELVLSRTDEEEMLN